MNYPSLWSRSNLHKQMKTLSWGIGFCASTGRGRERPGSTRPARLGLVPYRLNVILWIPLSSICYIYVTLSASLMTAPRASLTQGKGNLSVESPPHLGMCGRRYSFLVGARESRAAACCRFHCVGNHHVIIRASYSRSTFASCYFELERIPPRQSSVLNSS